MDYDRDTEFADGLRHFDGGRLCVYSYYGEYILDYYDDVKCGTGEVWDVDYTLWEVPHKACVKPAEGREEYVERWVARKRLQFPGLDVCVISKEDEEEGEYDDECR